jgi:putative nucleotidyltransferase with HDIG domain
MERQEAWKLLTENVANKNLRKHCLAAEALMRALARRLGEDEELWGLAGLVHDVDYDQTAQQPDLHAELGARMLAERGYPQAVVDAVRAHAGKKPVQTRMERALYAADPLTGFLVACALIHPQKKLSAIDLPFVQNRFGEKGFARGASRDIMKSCADLGLTLDEFLALGLSAMQAIAEDLGL